MGSVPWGLLEVIAAGCGPVVKLWNPSEPQQAISIYEGTAVYSLDFSHNNRVLAVAGEKGQAVLYGGKGAAVGTGCEPVGTIPRVPSETADSVTCLKFAPNDSYLLGGCRNGLLHIWSLKDETDYHMEPLNGSVTSAAVNPALTVLAASSASGQVLLCRYPTGQKFRTLVQKGPRAGCLGFAALQPSLLCGAKGSGQLLVWDIDHAGLGATEFNVHRAIVTGCSFVPNDPHLLVSCGEDGLLACTDRRTGGSAWDTNLRQVLASVSMKYDGSMVAVGTSAGKVLVHDTRRISTTLATQEFSDELPVTALRWQHQTPSKSHKSRPSMGGAAAASSAPRSSAAAPAGKPPGSVLSTGAGAAGAKGHASASAAAAAPAAPPAAGVGSAAAGASAAPAQPRAPLVVPGWDSGVKSAASVDSSDAEFGMRVMSPVRLYGSPYDSDVHSAGVPAAAGPGSFGTAAAAAATGGVHTAELGNAVLQTPTDSSASGAGYRGPTMFTPCVGYMGNMNSAGVTPFGGSTPDATPVSRLASAAPPPPPAAAVERPHESTSVAASSMAAAGDVRGAAGAKQVLQADAAAVPGRALNSRPTGSSAAATAAAAATAGRSSRPGTAGAGVTAGTSLHAAAATAAAGSAVGNHRRNTSDSAAATKAPAAAAATTAAPTVKHKGSNRSTRSSTGDDVSSGSAADGTVLVVTAPTGADGAAGKVVAVGAVGGTAAAGPQHISSSSHVGAAAAAAGGGGGGGVRGAPGSSAGASGVVAAAAAAGGVSGVTGVALREDVFKAYIDERFKEFEDKMIGIHNSMYNEFAQSQADLVVALNSLAARQDQLAEAVTALTAALESLSDNKQQQLQHTGIAAIPWI